MTSMASDGDPLFLAPDETRLTRLACPDCRGALARIDLPTISYYRCHVGHQWSPQSLAAAQADTAEDLLWAATAALEEHAAFQRHLATGESGEAAIGRGEAARRAAELTALLKEHLGQTPRNGQA